MSTDNPSTPIEVRAADLPLSCPRPDTPVWNLHPKVYLELSQTGAAKCPYCGATYQLKAGEKVHAH